MKGLWIRVEAHAVDSVIVAQLAESLGIEPVLALGHLTALGGAVAEHTEDGLIACVPNATIEAWGRWRGKRGDFARATREVLQDGDGRLVDWLETMGKLVDKRARERARKERERALRKLLDEGMSEDEARKVLGLSADGLRTGRGKSGATERNGTERTTTTRPAARAGVSFDDVMALVRRCLYIPDALPPAGWSEARDGSIVKQIAERHTLDDIATAIEGLELLRDHPGMYGDVVEWLRPGEKTTLRALYNTRSGVQPMFRIATQAYWKRANAPPKDQAEPARLGLILQRASDGGTPR